MPSNQNESDRREATARRQAKIWGWSTGIFAFLATGVFFVTIDPSFRVIAALAVGTWVGFFVRYRIYTTRMLRDRCPSCGTPGAMTVTDRAETLVSSTPRRKIQVAPNGGKPRNKPKIPLSRAEALQSMMERPYEQVDWLDEVVDVTETRKCASCGHEVQDRFEIKRQAGRQSRPVEH